ncbi:hypothetical protein TNIN_49621 [Trichonephila inaurata madagascariensis]|uniref:Uncharacterized protein n=1 Tax=Trichonephila inaurata madagascariensis TaxID=2747483 RepID=A0A8X7CMU4_9ARAC|nr:hypothetical protein TNIN_49621 [Trichonephila inaurata madagascariensis]
MADNVLEFERAAVVFLLHDLEDLTESIMQHGPQLKLTAPLQQPLKREEVQDEIRSPEEPRTETVEQFNENPFPWWRRVLNLLCCSFSAAQQKEHGGNMEKHGEQWRTQGGGGGEFQLEKDEWK